MPSTLRRAALALAVLGAAACNDSAGPDPKLLLVIADARANADFATSGQFTVEFVASDPTGALLAPSQLTLTGAANGESGLAPVSFTAGVPDSRAVSAIVQLDDSRSMGESDPGRQRGEAAQRFWSTLFSQRPGTQVALTDFGAYRPTSGFRYTRVLQPFTSDAGLLQAGLDSLCACGNTYAYGSLAEVARWAQAQIPDSRKRVMVMIADGATIAEDLPNESAALSAVADAGLVVNTVGIATASAGNPNADPSAVARLKDLAARTGGIYVPVDDPNTLAAVFRAIAGSASQGPLTAVFQLKTIPPSGSVVTGTLDGKANGATGQASFSFTAP